MTATTFPGTMATLSTTRCVLVEIDVDGPTDHKRDRRLGEIMGDLRAFCEKRSIKPVATWHGTLFDVIWVEGRDRHVLRGVYDESDARRIRDWLLAGQPGDRRVDAATVDDLQYDQND